jgi:hypothetical protein
VDLRPQGMKACCPAADMLGFSNTYVVCIVWKHDFISLTYRVHVNSKCSRHRRLRNQNELWGIEFELSRTVRNRFSIFTWIVDKILCSLFQHSDHKICFLMRITIHVRNWQLEALWIDMRWLTSKECCHSSPEHFLDRRHRTDTVQ